MADTKKRAEKRTTPTGTGKYLWLFKPDVKFDKDNKGGHYKATLILSGPDGEKLANTLEPLYTEAVAKGQKSYNEKKASPDKDKRPKKPFKAADRPWSHDEESGEYEFRFKLPAKITKKDGEIVDLAVAVFQKNGQPLPKDTKIGNGSRIQVSYEVRDFDQQPIVGAGISLRLLAVRFIELVEWNGGSADSFGFDMSEDDDEEEGTTSEETTSTTSGDEDEETDF